jgi:DNA polymerase III epsilon subunit-like protein
MKFYIMDKMMDIILKWNIMSSDEKKKYFGGLSDTNKKEFIKTIMFLKKSKRWQKHFEQYKKIMNDRSIMVMDLETTGFAHTSRIVQISFAIYDEDGTFREIHDHIIKQEKGIVIPLETIKVHGITDEIAETTGQELSDIVVIFENKLKTVSKIVGHNISFDVNIMKNELTRIGKLECFEYFSQINTYCTMKNTKYILQLKNAKGFIKNPKLAELYNYLFKEEINNQHNAKYDVLNTSKCYFEFIRLEKEINNIINSINNI